MQPGSNGLDRDGAHLYSALGRQEERVDLQRLHQVGANVQPEDDHSQHAGEEAGGPAEDATEHGYRACSLPRAPAHSPPPVSPPPVSVPLLSHPLLFQSASCLTPSCLSPPPISVPLLSHPPPVSPRLSHPLLSHPPPVSVFQ